MTHKPSQRQRFEEFCRTGNTDALLMARIRALGLPRCPIDPDNMKRESGPRVQIPFNHHAQGAQRKYRMALAKHRGF